MSVVWSDDEIGLLEALRPVCNTREIQTVFGKLTMERTMEAISKKSRQLGINFKDFGIPAMAGLSAEARQAIQEVLDDSQASFAALDRFDNRELSSAGFLNTDQVAGMERRGCQEISPRD
jgi:hypothetical protein